MKKGIIKKIALTGLISMMAVEIMPKRQRIIMS